MNIYPPPATLGLDGNMRRCNLPIFGLLLLVVLCFSATAMHAQSSRTFVRDDTTLPASCTNKALLFHLTQVDGANAAGVYRCNGSVYVAVGGGAAPAGSDNQLQKKNGSAFAGSLFSDNGTDADLSSGGLIFHGSTSGTTKIQATAIAGSTTVTLPATTGTLAEVLLSTTVVSLDDTSHQTLYSVPAGKTLLVIKGVLRATTSCALGDEATTTFSVTNGTTAIATASLGSATASTNFVVATPSTLGLRIAAGGSANAQFDVAYGDTCSATVYLFGFLY